MEKQLIPKLRFPEFKGDWKEVKYKDIYTFKTTNSLSRDNLNYEQGKVKNIHYGDIHTKFNTLFDIKKEKVPFINDDINISRIPNDCYLQEGDLVVADASEDYSDIGKMIEIYNLNGEKVLAGLHTFLARKYTDKMVTGFSSFLMKSWRVRYQIMRIAQGTKVLSLSNNRLAEITLLIPKQKEQQKIASFLTSVDERITLLTQQKEKLEQYKKGIMQQLFSQEIRFKDDNGKDFPEWEEKKLGDVGNTFNGLTGKTKEHFGKGKPYIQYMQIFSGSRIHINEFGLVKINENENQQRVQYGDVFFTTSSETPNEIGTSSVLLDNVDEVYLNSFCFGFRPNSLDELVPEYAQFLFRSPKMRDKIVPLAQGSTRFNMSKVQLLKISIKLPSNAEQKKMASFLSSIDSQIELVTNQIGGCIEFKKGLLQQMFV